MNIIDRVETAEAFLDWLQIAGKGEVCVYFRGHLSEARLTDRTIDKVGTAALNAAGYRHVVRRNNDRSDTYQYDGKPTVALVQKRCPQGYEYRAVKL